MSHAFCVRCVPPGVWAACAALFLLSSWAGSTLYHKPAVVNVTPPVPAILVIFDVYDTQGDRLKGASVKGFPDHPAPIDLGSGLEKSLPQDSRMALEFRYHADAQSETIVWQTQDSYKAWLRGAFPARLKALDAGYNAAKWDALIQNLNSTSTPTKYHYPVVFKAGG